LSRRVADLPRHWLTDLLRGWSRSRHLSQHRDKIIIHSLRIEHTYLTHGHLLREEAPPQCLACHVDLTVKHILLHCLFFTNACDNCFCVTLTSMSELFLKVASRSIIDFNEETGFYRKI